MGNPGNIYTKLEQDLLAHPLIQARTRAFLCDNRSEITPEIIRAILKKAREQDDTYAESVIATLVLFCNEQLEQNDCWTQALSMFTHRETMCGDPLSEPKTIIVTPQDIKELFKQNILDQDQAVHLMYIFNHQFGERNGQAPDIGRSQDLYTDLIQLYTDDKIGLDIARNLIGMVFQYAIYINKAEQPQTSFVERVLEERGSLPPINQEINFPTTNDVSNLCIDGHYNFNDARSMVAIIHHFHEEDTGNNQPRLKEAYDLYAKTRNIHLNYPHLRDQTTGLVNLILAYGGGLVAQRSPDSLTFVERYRLVTDVINDERER